MLLAPMMDIPNLFVTSRQAFTSIDREREILNFPNAPENRGRMKEGPVRSISMKGASFTYPGSDAGIRNLDLELESPATYALVGEVGSGKSTVLKMLAGLLPCEDGEIRVNGRDISDLSRDYLIGETGYVPQESVLFSQSVADNVRMGREIDDDRVAKALKVAGLDDAELQAGALTELGQGGTGVSGGQKQRVAIARALAGSPSLFLFDDCTAALDAEKEEAFWRELSRSRLDALILVVSHRIATVRRSDRVIFLHQGSLNDIGTHRELMERNRLYRLVLAAEME